MQPCDLAFGAKVFIAQATLGDKDHRFIILATSDNDIHNWWKGNAKRLVCGMRVNTDQPLKIVSELNITANSLVEFDAITTAYEALHSGYWGRDGTQVNNIHRDRLRNGTKYWHASST